MKSIIYKSILFSCLSLLGFNSVSAQVASNGVVSNNINQENPFFDAATNFDTASTGTGNNIGKGMYFPTTDLTKWTFKTTNMDGVTFPTAFDGMVVYNSKSGSTLSGQGIVTNVVPGFYYFSNPGASTSIAAGKWLPLGGATSPKVDVKTTETIINTLVDSKQIFAIKGSFTADGLTTAVSIPAPSGMTSLYGITIYQAGTKKVYSRDLYEYNIATTAGNAITGAPRISVVYPAGAYDYVLEYLK
jgi:hypothetical protein